MTDNSFQKNTISDDILLEFIREKRSNKRWQNFRFFFGLFVVLFIIAVMIYSSDFVSLGPSPDKSYVSFIRLEGMIDPGRDFSAEHVLPLLKDAFSDPQAKGVVIDINSGGGTPVQASIIHDAIIDLKQKYHKKVIVVGEDIMASGAYYIAVAGDKIYVNPNTITGSIGVIMKGFGFPDLIKKAGVERRVYTSGTNKDRLDPFLPQNKEDIEKIRQVIDEVHNNFNSIVIEGRKGKLRGNPQELFSGDFWSGQTALRLGLVDGLGNVTEILQKEFQVSRYRDYSSTRNFFKSMFSAMGASLDMNYRSELWEGI